MNESKTCDPRCQYCGANAGQTFVHGHYQCNSCKQNVMPCCNGFTQEYEQSTADLEYHQYNGMSGAMTGEQQIALF